MMYTVTRVQKFNLKIYSRLCFEKSVEPFESWLFGERISSRREDKWREEKMKGDRNFKIYFWGYV